MIMIGPLPNPVEVSRQCSVDNGLRITWAYTTAQMEAERQRCYALGAKHMRDLCAVICRSQADDCDSWDEGAGGEGGRVAANMCADAILAAA